MFVIIYDSVNLPPRKVNLTLGWIYPRLRTTVLYI